MIQCPILKLKLLFSSWPVYQLTVTSESIKTYPEHSVDVILEFPTVQQCAAEGVNAMDLPEFWIEVFYCGRDVYCSSSAIATSPPSTGLQNSTSPTLYAELVRGYPRHRVIQLRCELFGLAGNYAVKLRAAESGSTFIGQTAFVKVRSRFIWLNAHPMNHTWHFTFISILLLRPSLCTGGLE